MQCETSHVSLVQRAVDLRVKTLDSTEMLPKDPEARERSTGNIPHFSQMQASSLRNAADECLATDLETLLKGLQTQHQDSVNAILAYPLIALLILSTVMLLIGHWLVTPVVLVSTISGTFFLTFEIFLAISTSCTLPVYAGAVAGLLAGAIAMCFLELAIIIPGAVFGAIAAYQLQSILLVVSPSLAQKGFMVDYFWSIALCSALLFAYLAHRLREDIFILVTSTIGAYGIEISLRGLLEDFTSYSMTPLASLGCMVLALAIGLVVQHRSYVKT